MYLSETEIRTEKKLSLAQVVRFQPISCHWSLSMPPENTRKPEVR